MKKTLTFFLFSLFFISLVSAGTFQDIKIDIPTKITAGSPDFINISFYSNESFPYFVNVNITNFTKTPGVWLNDFTISGCNEIKNGSFVCNRTAKVGKNSYSLNISSKVNLWPGNYTIHVDLSTVIKCCDKDEDCPQSTEMCDYNNRVYCTRDAYGTCNGNCECLEDAWNCGNPDDVDYCSNCVHCGDTVVNCGEECEIGQTLNKCLPEGTEILTCINNVSYVYPKYNYCKDTCEWDNCKTKIETENDPRCIPPTPPTCSWRNIWACFPFNKPTTTTTIPSFNIPKPPSFTFPSFDFSSLFRR